MTEMAKIFYHFKVHSHRFIDTNMIHFSIDSFKDASYRIYNFAFPIPRKVLKINKNELVLDKRGRHYFTEVLNLVNVIFS